MVARTMGSTGILLLILCIVVSGASAGKLFTEIEEPVELLAVDPAIVLRQRAVSVDSGQWSSGRVKDTLVINFFDDTEIHVILPSIGKDDTGSGGRSAWRQRTDSGEGGMVTLARQGESISIIAIVGERRFDVRPLKRETGIHVIQEIALPQLRAVTGDEPLADRIEYATAGMNDEANQVFALTNQERAKYNLPPFQADARLVSVAQTHSQAQADANDMFHTSDTAGLYADQGYTVSGWAENVAYGSSNSSFATPEGVLLGWMNSSGHRQNILSDNCDLGVGRAEAGNGHVYWTQNFGIERGDAPCSQTNPDGGGDTPDDAGGDDDSSGSDGGGSGCFVKDLSPL